MAINDHVNWLLEGAKAWNARRKLVEFAPDLSGVDFTAVLGRLSGRRSPSFFKRFNFNNSDLRSANFSGLDFSGSSFVEANLTEADLSEAKFYNARMDRANLTQVKAVNTDFTAARLLGTNFDGANLLEAKFDRSTLDVSTLDTSQQASISAGVRFEEQDGWGAMVAHSAPAEPAPEAVLVKPKDPQYLVMFATNRSVEKGDLAEYFGDGRSQTLNFGSCKVIVPDTHKVGSIGSPFWKRWITRRDDRLKLDELVRLNGELYWRLVSQNFSHPDASPPTILIHGYRTSFEDAVLWAAQIGYDLGLERGVSLFSWPSQGKLASYLADEAAVDYSKYHLVQYLLEFMKAANGRPINVLAHSMGCRCLIGALEVIGLQHPEAMRGFGELIFAAADVDQDAMRNIGAHVIGNRGRTTSYVCSDDKALKTSGWLHKYARVGLLPPVFLMDDVDTIEVEKTDLLGLGHGYVSGAKEILGDMHELLKASTHPDGRFSVRAVPNVPGHWKLKE